MESLPNRQYLTKPGDNDGDRTLPDNGTIDLLTQRVAFFDRYLKNDQAVTIQEDRVKIYITGAQNPTPTDGSISQPFPFPHPIQATVSTQSRRCSNVSEQRDISLG